MRTRVPALALALVLALAGCTGDGGDGEEESSGPDPQDTATALASGLAAKDLSKVAFTPETATAAQASYDRIIQQLGDAGLQVDVSDVERTGSTAEATLHWTWDLTAASWEYDAPGRAEVRRGRLAGGLGAVDRRGEPGRRRGAGRLLGAGRPRRHPRRRRRADRHRAAGRRGSASTSRPSRAPTRRSRHARWPGWSASTRRRTSKAVTAAGRAGVRRGDRLPPRGAAGRGDRRRRRRSRAPGSSPATCRSRRPATSPLPLLGRVGEVTAEIIAEHPEYHPGDLAGLSGLQARYDERLRGTPGVSVVAVPDQGTVRELFRTEATPGDPLLLSLDVDLETDGRGAARRRRARQRAGRDPARAPARSSRPPTDRAPVGRTWRRSARPHRGRRSRS